MFPSNRLLSHDNREVRTPDDLGCDSMPRFAIGCTMTSAIARAASGERCLPDWRNTRIEPHPGLGTDSSAPTRDAEEVVGACRTAQLKPVDSVNGYRHCFTQIPALENVTAWGTRPPVVSPTESLGRLSAGRVKTASFGLFSFVCSPSLFAAPPQSHPILQNTP